MVRYREYEITFFPPLTPVVRWLLIITGGAFVLTYFPLKLAHWQLPYHVFGLTPYMVTHGLYLWQPFTYLFLHAGFFHIIFNLYVLWVFGPDVENAWGGRRFLFYYFLTGTGGGIVDILIGPGSPVMTIGCSGALFGVMLAYAVLFPNRIIYYLIIPMKAKWFVAIIAVIEFVDLLSSPNSGVSYIAHVSGLLIGYLYLRGLRPPSGLRRQYDDWKRARLRKQFEIYMREHKKKDDTDHWIN
ncbi:MAG: rhomboid family intramembrane serine protease [Acidobacteriota bacterium]|nr:rhomboid family intramembrane serine protease [Acidobacteriota bacterium]